MAIVDLRVESIQDLITQVIEIKLNLNDDSFLWYRGQEHSSYTMTPKLLREGKSEDDVFEREKRLLTRFRQRSLPYWPAGYPQNDWEQLFAMQHYGLPTRLLDWSENLFVAAYFALSKAVEAPAAEEPIDGAALAEEILAEAPEAEAPIAEEASVPVVYCIDPVRWNRSTPLLSEYGESISVLTTVSEDLEAYSTYTNKKRAKSPVALFGTHNSGRIVSQRGTFVVWGADVKPLEDFARSMTDDVLWRISIIGDAYEMYKNLHTLGFSETMIFPELTYLATELTRTEGWRK